MQAVLMNDLVVIPPNDPYWRVGPSWASAELRHNRDDFPVKSFHVFPRVPVVVPVNTIRCSVG